MELQALPGSPHDLYTFFSRDRSSKTRSLQNVCGQQALVDDSVFAAKPGSLSPEALGHPGNAPDPQKCTVGLVWVSLPPGRVVAGLSHEQMDLSEEGFGGLSRLALKGLSRHWCWGCYLGSWGFRDQGSDPICGQTGPRDAVCTELRRDGREAPRIPRTSQEEIQDVKAGCS